VEVTNLDYILGAVLLISAIVGFIRGATREVVAVVAFIAAVVVAIVALRFTAPPLLAMFDAEWIAKAVALLATFLAVYIALRLLGGAVTKKIHATHLGAIDRAVGLGFGLVRALVILGLFNLVFHAATPPERTPRWVVDAQLYPLTAFCAEVLTALAPRGAEMFDKVAPALGETIADSGDTPPHSAKDKRNATGYDARDRKALDDLVEKSL
jgi:membrane protein required for colicin V production